jgi:hypothetical protein
MATNPSKEDLVFNYRTLRLIIGALAFAFPAVVIALTGKITTSISASYHEVETREVFVGFLFILGALLISYKGHLQGETKKESETIWQWIVSFRWLIVYQEDIISTIGGFAAIFTALYPTACDGCSMDTRATIHTTGAFILFSTVVYFSLIAFLRSLNQKLLGYADLKQNSVFMEQIATLRKNKSRAGINVFKRFWNFLTLEIQIFLVIAAVEFRVLDREKGLMRVFKLLGRHGKKIARGVVYVVCGILIAVTLLAFIVLSVANSSLVAYPATTFVVETISLVLFGIAWMTASKLEYIATIVNWWRSRQKTTATFPQPEVGLFQQDSAQETP